MSSALKPAFAPGPNAPAGQPATAVSNHNAQAHLGQMAQNMAHPSQNMTHVTQNMAQMAQNMSNHGNLSHPAPITHVPNQFPAAQPNKPNAPLSLVHDKTSEIPANSTQPLALTRGTEKKELESNLHKANGTTEVTKVVLNATTSNPPGESDLPKPPATSDSPKVNASPSQNKTPTPTIEVTAKDATPIRQTTSQVHVNKPESVSEPAGAKKPLPDEENKEKNTPSVINNATINVLQSTSNNTGTKSDTAGVDKVDGPSPFKNADKSSASQGSVKAAEIDSKDTTRSLPLSSKEADVKKAEPINNDKTSAKEPTNATKVKTIPETIDNKLKSSEVNKPVELSKENKTETVSETKTETSKTQATTVPKTIVPEPAKISVPKKIETKPPTPKSTLKLATVTPIVRKRRQESKSPVRSSSECPSPPKKQPEASKTELLSTPTDSRLSKRNRTKVQPYQSPTPDIAMATKLSASAGRSTPTKHVDDKLIVFYKNEYLAVRNAEGSFYVCQTTQNVYRASRKIKIRWLSQDKTLDPTGETYKPDFYDITDMECVLTTLSLSRSPHGGGAQVLKAAEAARASSILQRALAAEQGGEAPSLQLTEEHPDGLDLSLYTDESQLEKKQQTRKRQNSGSSEQSDSAGSSPAKSPKRAPKTPKKSPKNSAAKTPASAKRKSKPVATPKAVKVTPPSKAAVVPAKTTPTKAKEPAKKALPAKATPIKVTPVKSQPKTPKATAKTPAKKIEKAPPVPTPSTSTGKTTRTPRKLPTKK